MGLSRWIMNHIKQRAIQQLADSSGLARDMIKINNIKKYKSAQRQFGVKLEYVPATSEQALADLSLELVNMAEDEVLKLVGKTPVTYITGLNVTEAQGIVKSLKNINIKASVID